VKATQEQRDRYQGLVRLRPGRIWRHRHVTRTKDEPLTAVPVTADWRRRSIETFRLEPPQQLMN
jgi:hypothetical protein